MGAKSEPGTRCSALMINPHGHFHRLFRTNIAVCFAKFYVILFYWQMLDKFTVLCYNISVVWVWRSW